MEYTDKPRDSQPWGPAQLQSWATNLGRNVAAAVPDAALVTTALPEPPATTAPSLVLSAHVPSGNRCAPTPANVIGRLVDLGIFDLKQFGPSHADRARFIASNIDAVRQYFSSAIELHADHPMVHEVMQTYGIGVGDIHILIAEMQSDIVRHLNTSDTVVADQTPHHLREIYPEVEDKEDFVGGFDWMKSKVEAKEREYQANAAQFKADCQVRLEKLHAAPEVHLESLCLGSGGSMTMYWEYAPDKESGRMLFVAPSQGAWGGPYQLAQDSGLVEIEPGHAPSDFNPNIEEAIQVSPVDAAHLYRSLMASRVKHAFPAVPAEVVKIVSRPQGGYESIIKYQLHGTQNFKSVSSDRIIVGTGSSVARNTLYQKGCFYIDDFRDVAGNNARVVFRALSGAGYFEPSGASRGKQPDMQELQRLFGTAFEPAELIRIAATIDQVNDGRALLPGVIGKADYEQLSRFDPDKGYTPIVDGNTFVLSDVECDPKGRGRTVMIWGGGATASAAVRRALFLRDRPDVKLSPQTYERRVNDVTWMARRGLDTLGGSTVEVDASRTLRGAGRLWPYCELVGIDRDGEGMQMRIRKLIPQDREAPGTIMASIDGVRTPCLEQMASLPVDQLVFCQGQDNRSVEQIFDDDIVISIDTAYLRFDDAGKMPMYATLKEHPDIQFHGATMTSSIVGEATASSVEEVQRRENIPVDVGAAGMPYMRSHIRASHFVQSKQHYPRISASVDFSALIDSHLEHWGIGDPAQRQGFVGDLVRARSETSGGITTRTLKALLRKHRLDKLLTVVGTSTLEPIRVSPPRAKL